MSKKGKTDLLIYTHNVLHLFVCSGFIGTLYLEVG